MRRNNSARRLIGSALALVAVLITPLAPASKAAAATYPSPQAIEDAFKGGLRALAAGDTGNAIRAFRSILAQDPDLPRVRLELARAYFQAREWARSRREFFAVLSGDVPDTVKSNIITFLRAIDARRGFDWNLSLSLVGSPQGTRSYDSDTVTIDVLGTPLPFEFERDSDGEYGLSASGNAEYRHPFPALSGDDVKVTGLAEAFFSIFEGNGSGADDYLIGGGLGLRGAWRQTTLTGKTVVSAREFGGEHFQDRYELQGSAEWRNRAGLSLFASGAAGYVDDHISEFRDGRTVRLRAGTARSIGGRSIAGMALFGESYDADARFESYLTLGGELFATTDLGSGFDARGRAYFLNQDYAAKLPLLPKIRKEQEYGFDIELSKSDFFLLGQFTPFVKLGFSRRDSSMAAFSYDESRFGVGLKKTF